MVADVLLLQGPRESFDRLLESRELWLLDELPHIPFRRRKGLVALGLLIGAVTAGALGALPLSIALLLASLLAALFGSVKQDQVYRYIDWRLLVLIGGMISVGSAMQKTGAAALLAKQLVYLAEPFGIYFVLATFVFLTMLLTQPLSNAAAALVVMPIAIATAQQLGANPRTFGVLVTIAASLSFVTPLEPACLLVYGPGRYRFLDFVKVGSVLSLVTSGVVLWLVPRLWPL
jgi:di/tricarboxylate transporter